MNPISNMLSTTCLLLLVSLMMSANTQVHAAEVATPALPSTRDPWLWPFSQDSIWNMPISTGAVYEPAHISPARHIGVDLEYHVRTQAGDPTCTIRTPSDWKQRWPGKREIGSAVVPADLVIADVNPPHTPNAVLVLLQPDGRTLVQLEPACRPTPGTDHIVGYRYHPNEDLYGKGIGGSHFGSGLSGIGGSIRKGELTSNEPIRHALKINIWAKRYLYYGDDRKGFRWPANRADGYAETGYGGKNIQLVMGSLLAIPPQVTAEQLQITTPVGLKLFAAFQDYGAYIADDSAWDSHDLCVEIGVPEEVNQVYSLKLSGRDGRLFDDINRLFSALSIITNNTPATIGGGGTPRRALAPRLSEP